ncbi:MAG TPA: sulfite oxidase [Bryobacteraceae bacterium]|nr:sulfite oxidase [Bryobacteraceae bacterium]
MKDDRLERRRFLQRSALALPFLWVPSTAAQERSAGGLIIRQREPENLEFAFSTLDSYLVPNERFYIRSHFPTPALSPASHRIRVEGAVDAPFEIGFEELRGMTQRSVTATLECAGNSRVFLVPQAAGVQWEMGAVGNAEWGGVPLAALLERARVKSNAVDVVLEGADEGELRNDPRPPGVVKYFRSIPLAKARRPEVLLAHQMNGRALPPSHGFPVRAIVPGYYGMSSVKWLSRIHVTSTPFQGYWQTIDYAYWERGSGSPTRQALMDMTLKSLIARPTLREVIKSGTTYRVFGAAWTGDADISKVEVSVDGSRTWAEAQLIDKPSRFAWRRWQFEWRVAGQPGRMTVLSRATDSNGVVQPVKHNPDTGSYAIHHSLPIEVEVI